MTIKFDDKDRAKVAQRIKDYGLYVTKKRVQDVLQNVEATFTTDALENEIDYMIENFEVS